MTRSRERTGLKYTDEGESRSSRSGRNTSMQAVRDPWNPMEDSL
jgi:hypothetical protein